MRIRSHRSVLLVATVLALNTSALAKEVTKSVCQREGETLILDTQSKNKGQRYILAICQKGVGKSQTLRARNLAKSEVNKMYAATRGEPNQIEKWSRYLDVKADEITVFNTIKEIPETELLTWQDHDKNVLADIGSLYQKHVSQIGGSPRVLTPEESKIAQKDFSSASDLFAECLLSRGSLVMAEVAEGSGCFCGKQKYTNFVDLQCKDQKNLVSRTSSPAVKTTAEARSAR